MIFFAKNENKFSRNFRENTKTKIFVSTLTKIFFLKEDMMYQWGTPILATAMLIQESGG
jgi:hypothetical protein